MRSLCNQKKKKKIIAQKGFKVSERFYWSRQRSWSIAGSNWSWAVFRACTKGWPRLIWSLRGFIGHLEVSKRSYVSCRSVSLGAVIGFTTKMAGIFAMQRWLISNEVVIDRCFSTDKSAISCKVVSKRAPNILRWVYKHHRTVWAWQRHFATSAQTDCNCPVVNILKTCKEMIWIWKASFLYAFVLIENRSTVSYRPVTPQLQPVTDLQRLVADRSQQNISLSPYLWLTVANRTLINRWQVAKLIAD